MRVFIVDDSSVIVERLTLLLEDIPGVELVGHAADVPQAIQGLLETTPDALVLDLHLPGGTGLDVLVCGNCFLLKSDQDASLATRYEGAFDLD